MRSTRFGLAASALVLMATGIACGTESPANSRSEVGTAIDSSLDAALPCSWDNSRFEVGAMGVNQLANISDAAIVGDIVSVSPPRWNSKDGKDWCPPVESFSRPILYRDVVLKITEAVFGSEVLAPKVGDELVVRSFGDGTSSGQEVAKFNDGSKIHERDVDGRLEPGRSVFLLLSVWDEFPTETGPELVTQITGSWMGNWEVERSKETARSVQAERDVPLRALINRLMEERNAGRKPERDVNTTRNPLASSGGPKDVPGGR